MPLEYSWTRADKPLPAGTLFRHDNRVMVIPRARFEDGGTYTCKVMKTTGKQNIDTRDIVLVLEGTVGVSNHQACDSTAAANEYKLFGN